ncbi:hypothetical protein E3U43_000012 [Larimichthys crocea]|uniref:Uncharacterized protein n=1 Tax=Larimichthys crocea TaxID=215358 RepID=A0ACD3Q7K3_LARCR|nr:hypothetical protein E3U43_000012 [Larimichthys crocea]
MATLLQYISSPFLEAGHDGTVKTTFRAPRYSQELQSPPRYSMAGYCGPPPSYNELGLKPDDLPPSYTEYNTPVCPITPPPHTDMVQPQAQSQQ